MVYVGTGGKPPSSNTTGLGTLVGYGLLNQGLGAPTNLVVQAASPSEVHLTWTRNSSSKAQMLIGASTNGTSFTALVYLPNGSTSYDDLSVGPGTQYFYRVRAISGPSSGTPSTVGSVTAPTYPRGDFNLDHAVNSADVPAMLVALTDLPTYQFNKSLSNADLSFLADVNGDQAINNADLQALLTLLASGGGSQAVTKSVATEKQDFAVPFSVPSATLSESNSIWPLQSPSACHLRLRRHFHRRGFASRTARRSSGRSPLRPRVWIR